MAGVRDAVDRALRFGPRRIRNTSLAVVTVAALAAAGGTTTVATPSTDACATGAAEAAAARAPGLDASPPSVTLADVVAERRALCGVEPPG